MSDEPRSDAAAVVARLVEFVEYMRMVHTAFPDFRNVVEEVVVEGDRAFARLAYSGTHRGTVLGVEPTGRRVQYAGAALFRVRDGRIASLWVLGDMYALARQLRDDARVTAHAGSTSIAWSSMRSPSKRKRPAKRRPSITYGTQRRSSSHISA